MDDLPTLDAWFRYTDPGWSVRIDGPRPGEWRSLDRLTGEEEGVALCRWLFGGEAPRGEHRLRLRPERQARDHCLIPPALWTRIMDSAALLIDQGWTVSELPWKLGEGQASGQIAVSGSDELSRDLRYRLGRAVRPVIGPEELRDHDLLVVGDRSRDADARRW